jgi:hypothetical protein
MESIFQEHNQSFADFYDAIKDVGLKVTRRAAKEFYDRQESTEVFRRNQKPNYIPITCPLGIGCLQADLLDVSRLSSHNRNVKFLLNVVEVTSRYAWSFPLKNKQAKTVLPGLKQVVEFVRKTHPTRNISLTTDDGGEFKGVVSKYLKEQNIQHYQSTNKHNTSIVERLHINIWNYLKKRSTILATFSIINDVQKYLHKYNVDKTHSTLNTTPASVFINGLLVGNTTVYEPKLKVGDLVRKSNQSGTFSKRSFENRFSNDVYEIRGRVGHRFQLKNIASGHELKTTYLERNLMKVNQPAQHSTQSKRIEKLNHANQVRRRMVQEPAFQIGVREKERIEPRSSQRARAPRRRFEVDGY